MAFIDPSFYQISKQAQLESYGLPADVIEGILGPGGVSPGAPPITPQAPDEPVGLLPAGMPVADGVAEYYGDTDFAMVPTPGPSDSVGLVPAGIGIIAVGATWMIARFGSTIIALLRPLGALYRGRLTVAWARLPAWVKTGLVAVGFTAGANLVIDGITDGEYPVIPADGTGFMPTIIGSWTANDRTFYRLSDGKLATQKNDGSWTVWRPKKPIVIYATGQKDMGAILRADAVVSKYAGKMGRMLRRRGYEVRRKVTAKVV